LGRVLRQPIVPFNMLGNPPFSVALDTDAAVAFVAAAKQRANGPLNVVADGEITLMQAIRRGRRVPLPLIGPQWPIARHVSHMFGAPIPDHVMELIHHGRVADGARLSSVLGVAPRVATPDVIDRLFNWEGVIRIPPTPQAA
jgi:UDP-glucose 4-epimerase